MTTNSVEVSAGPTTQIKNGIGGITLNRIQERRVVLVDIVVPSAVPIGSCRPIVMPDRQFGNPSQLLCIVQSDGCGHGSADIPRIVATPTIVLVEQRMQGARGKGGQTGHELDGP